MANGTPWWRFAPVPAPGAARYTRALRRSSSRQGRFKQQANEILSRPGAINSSGMLNPRVMSLEEARIVAESDVLGQEERQRGRVVSSAQAGRNLLRAFMRPLVPESAVRDIKGPWGTLARAARELSYPAAIAATTLTAGLGPGFAAAAGGVRATQAAAGAGARAGGLAALKGLGAATSRGAATLVSPITRGGFASRLAGEQAVGIGAGAAAETAARAIPEDAPAALRLGIPLLAGLAGGGGAIGGIAAAPAAARAVRTGARAGLSGVLGQLPAEKAFAAGPDGIQVQLFTAKGVGVGAPVSRPATYAKGFANQLKNLLSEPGPLRAVDGMSVPRIGIVRAIRTPAGKVKAWQLSGQREVTTQQLDDEIVRAFAGAVDKPRPRPKRTAPAAGPEPPVSPASATRQPEVVPYSRALDIRNIDALPRGTGAKFLVAIRGQGDEFVASRWARVAPKRLKPREVLIEMQPRAARETITPAPEGAVERIRPGDTGAIQEGRAARALGSPPEANPYRQAMQQPEIAGSDEAFGRFRELRDAWDSGYAQAPAVAKKLRAIPPEAREGQISLLERVIRQAERRLETKQNTLGEAIAPEQLKNTRVALEQARQVLADLRGEAPARPARAKATPAAEREPWQMTKAQAAKAGIAPDEHADAIARALTSDEKVPANVLKQFPELAPRTVRAATVAPAAVRPAAKSKALEKAGVGRAEPEVVTIRAAAPPGQRQVADALSPEAEASLRATPLEDRPGKRAVIERSTTLTPEAKELRLKILDEPVTPKAAPEKPAAQRGKRFDKRLSKTETPAPAPARGRTRQAAPVAAEAAPAATPSPTRARPKRRTQAPQQAQATPTRGKRPRKEPPAPGQEAMEPPVDVPPADGAGAIPPAESGNRFLGDYRPFDEVQSEVVTTNNQVKRWVAGKSGVNPSVLDSSETAKAVTAYARQQIAARELVDTGLSALDAHAQRFTGRLGHVIPIDQETGFLRGTNKPWQDVFSNPDAHNLTPETRAYINDFNAIVQEAEALRVAHGLQPLSTGTAEGWYYVPRQVKSRRGIEVVRPSSAKLQRIYEEALEGYQAGVRYDVDPRSTLEIHLRSAYKEMLNKQLDDWLIANTARVTPLKLIDSSIRIRMEEASKRRFKAGKEVERLKVPVTERPPRGQVTKVRQARTTVQRALDKQRAKAKAELDAARREYDLAKTPYKRAMSRARQESQAPGNLFGRADSEIPISTWKNRFFPDEDAKALREGISSFGQQPQMTAFSRGLQTTANTVRFLSAVGDFAMPFIQGQPVLWRNPVLWSRMTARHYQAFFDPAVQARFIQDHLATFHEMAKHGIPVGDPEFFAALRPGEGFSPGALLEKLPKGEEARALLRQGGKQTFGRFQASYNMGLTSLRAQMWEALSPKWADKAELAAYIRNLTGGLDSAALGVGPSQRAGESVWLAFSPRLLRSTVGLVADALRPGTQRGRESLRTLASWAGGTMGMYVLSGLALGKDWEEIQTGLNPLSGRKFLSHEINGDWVGVGGQLRGLMQVMARVTSSLAPGGEPADALVSGGIFQNPLIQAYFYRGAPALNIVGGIAEAGLQRDILPFDEVDSLPDLGKHIFTSALPFALQGSLEGEQALTTLIALAGARTSPGTFRGQEPATQGRPSRPTRPQRTRPRQPIRSR